MALIYVKAGQAAAHKRRVRFDLRDAADFVTPRLGEGGGQPEIAVNGPPWTSAGIGALQTIGNGLYFADMDAATVATRGDCISTRYKSANTPETPGDTVRVVAFDLDDPDAMGLAFLDVALSSRADGDDYTAGRAALLDRLDAAISTRADAAEWTAPRAAFLDAAVSSRSTLAAGPIWDYLTADATVMGSFGRLLVNRLDAAISSLLTAGNVTVGGYAAGQSPADLVLVTAANKLVTDGAGAVTAGTVTDKTGYSLATAAILAIWHQLESAIVAAGSIGLRIKQMLDAAISSRSVVTDASIALKLRTEHGVGSWGTAGLTGGGAKRVTIPFLDDQIPPVPVQGALVTIWNAAQTLQVSAPKATDSNGEVSFNLSPGAYVAVVQSSHLYQTLAPQAFTVT